MRGSQVGRVGLSHSPPRPFPLPLRGHFHFALSLLARRFWFRRERIYWCLSSRSSREQVIILTPESSSSRHLIQLVTACNRGNYAVKRLQKRILNKYCSIETIPSEKPILTPNCQVDPTQRKNVNDLTFQERKDLNKALGKMKTLSD